MSTPCQRLASRIRRKDVIIDDQPKLAMVDDIRVYSNGQVWQGDGLQFGHLASQNQLIFLISTAYRVMKSPCLAEK